MNAKQLQAASLPPSWAGMANSAPSWADVATQQPAWASNTNAQMDWKSYMPMIALAVVALVVWRKYA